jgi:hypothetical protein
VFFPLICVARTLNIFLNTRFNYKPKRGSPENVIWPPKGLHLKIHFRAPEHPDVPIHTNSVQVTVHYEIFDGVPFMSKWITIHSTADNMGYANIGIESIEIMSLNWQWAPQGYGWLQVVPDQPRGTKINWFRTEAKAEAGSFQPVLDCTYDSNFTLQLVPGEEVNSYKVMTLVIGTADQERVGLSLRRLKRLLAPQSQENPIYFHMTNGSSVAFRQAVDQLVKVGFEMIFYSFGSGFDLEANDLDQLKEDIGYANSKGIEVGGYDLIAWTRKVPDHWLALTNETGPSACMASGWYDYLLSKVKRVVKIANLTAIETDGPYPGYTCSSLKHAHHKDKSDSTYQQSRLQAKFYLELHRLGMFINQPDDYFFFGANKAGSEHFWHNQ